MIQLNHILRKCTGGYKLTKSKEKINHLMHTDDIKQFAKNEKELEPLTQTVRIYSQDIGMEFGIEKLNGYFKRQTSRISCEKTWTWLRKRNLEKETESLLIAAQNNAIRIDYVKARIRRNKIVNVSYVVIMTVIPIVIGALGMISKSLLRVLEKFEIKGRAEILISVLLRSVRILRKGNWMTCSHSDSNERLSANIGVKNPQRVLKTRW